MKKTQRLSLVLKGFFAVENLSVDCISVSGGDIHSSFVLVLTGDKSLPS